jgi:hypothetical protein
VVGLQAGYDVCVNGTHAGYVYMPVADLLRGERKGYDRY